MSRFSPHLRFSLRTFFVFVTLLLVLLGWMGREWQAVVQRREAVRLLNENITSDTISSGLLVIYMIEERPSWLGRLLGDETLGDYYVLPLDKENRDRILAAFPEPEIGRYYNGGIYPVDRNSLK